MLAPQTERMRSTDHVVSQRRSTPQTRVRRDVAWRRGTLRLLISSLAMAAVVAPQGGCGLLSHLPPGKHDTKESFYRDHAMQIEYPQVAECATAPSMAAEDTVEPLSIQDPANLPALEMTLEEAVQRAVQQSPVLRRIGGTIVTTPQGSATIYDPSLVFTSPQSGSEAALANFDAQYTQSLFWNSNDVPNNVDLGPIVSQFNVLTLRGRQAAWNNELAKTTATGARFALRSVVNYDLNNRPNRLFNSDFVGWVEAEVRQPLGQGAGTTFNRIAGPTTVPGQYNGVLIARVNEDVALADFEAAVIQLVADVEQAYWDLYTAYRVLAAVAKGRESALQTYQYQQVRLEVGVGRRDEEAQARSQFFDFENQVQQSLGGVQGLYALEQQLRYLIGMPATDGALIRPTTEPTDTRVVFDWNSALGQALDRRVEIRRQRFSVSRREMELVAARLNRRPRFDIVSSYRWRGLGDHLIGGTDEGNLDNLVASITGGNFQEWRAGGELTFPVGLRAASVAIANARLNLSRERALLSETELRISHDLTNAGRQVEINHTLLDTNYNRYLADQQQLDVLRRRYEDGQDPINFLLQAQRQLVISEAAFYRTLSDYNLAIRDFHRQKGSLLAYNQVQLAEGPWAAGALQDAYQKGRFLTPRRHPESVEVPRPITSGPFDPSAIQGNASTAAEPIPTSPSDAMVPGTDSAPPANPTPETLTPPEAQSAVTSPAPQRLIIEGGGSGLIGSEPEASIDLVREVPQLAPTHGN